MAYVVGFTLGIIVVFGLAFFVLKCVENCYKKEVKFYKEEIERLDKWINKKSKGEISEAKTR